MTLAWLNEIRRLRREAERYAAHGDLDSAYLLDLWADENERLMQMEAEARAERRKAIAAMTLR